MDEACETYLERHVSRGGRTDAQDRNLVVVRRTLGARRVVDLLEEHVDHYVAGRVASGIATGTVRRELGALRAALVWAERKGLVPAGSVVDYDLPPEGAPKRRYLSEAEAKAVLAMATSWVTAPNKSPSDQRAGLFVCIALETAARAGAIRELTWGQIDWQRNLISFVDPAQRAHNKRRAVVPISRNLRPVLDDALLMVPAPMRQTDPVLGHTGSVRKGFERLRSAVGIDFTIHDMRRTWASLKVARGVRLQDVAAVLGDSVEVVEKHYAVFSPDYLRNVMDA